MVSLTFASILASAGIDPADALVIRHAYVRDHEDGTAPIHADSTDEEVLVYTQEQSLNPRIFPAEPPPTWVVFLPEGGERARLWSVLTNHGETTAAGASKRTFTSRRTISWRTSRIDLSSGGARLARGESMQRRRRTTP